MLRCIAAITRLPVGVLPLVEHATRMAEQARTLLAMDACVIRLLEGNDLVLLASSGLPDPCRHPRIPIGWGISQEIMDGRVPLFIPDVREHRATSSTRCRMDNSYMFVSYAGAPMLAGDSVIGIIGLYSTSIRHDLSETDLICIHVLANTMAVAIANDRLYEQLRRDHDALQSEIDKRMRAQEESRALRDDLARVARVTAMGELTATIAHEVNQPLGAIISNAQACQRFLNRTDPDLGQVRNALNDVVKDALRATDTITRIRKFLQKGNREHTPIELNQVIHAVTGMLSDRTQKEGVILSLSLSDDLPRVSGDVIQLQQVVLNLLNNAIEAVTSLDTARRVTITTRKTAEGMACVSVQDNGPGISAANAGRLFEPFFTTKPRGMGMGLAICRSVLEAHGGTIWVESDEETGTLIRFTLPACEDST
jgi:C4-dicarboxylate-specific signal transduction histidine kinase